MSLSVSLPAALSGKVVLGVTVAALATSGAGAAAITAATSSHQQSRPATSAAAHESTGSNQSQAAFGQSVADQVKLCREQGHGGFSNVGLCVSDYARSHNPGATNRPADAGKPATTGSNLNPTSAPPTTPVGSPDSHPTGAPVSHPGPTDHPGRP
jgi:hypothetical protein